MPQRASRRLCYSLVAVIALASAPAHAEGSVFAFGDSLVDNGRLYRQTGKDGAESPPYFGGRYSNGPTFAEVLPGLLGMGWTDGNDFAISGATSGEKVNGAPHLPGFAGQVHDFAASGGRFSARDLPVVWVGANDYLGAAKDNLFGLLLGSDAERLAIFTPVARAAVTNTVQAVATMYGIGARRAVVLALPPMGHTPALSAYNFTDMGDRIAAAHNDALRRALAQVNQRTGMNIYFVNTEMAFRMVLANPGKFGFSNVSGSCLGDAACKNAPATEQNRYIFFDDLHPTAAMHALVARIVANQVSAGAGVDRPGYLSAKAASDFTRGVLWGASRNHTPARASQLAGPSPFVFASIGAGRGRNPAAEDREAFRFNRQSVSGGVGVDFDQTWRMGLSFGGDNLDSSGGIARVQGRALHAALFGEAEYDGWFGAAVASIHDLRFKSTRDGLLAGETITASPKGRGYTIAMDTGRRFRLLDNLQVAPVIGVRHTGLRMAAWQERGLPLLVQRVEADRRDTTVLSAGVQISGDWTSQTGLGELRFSPFADIRLAVAPASAARDIRSSFDSAQGLTIHNRTPADRDPFGELQVGLSVSLADYLRNDLTVNATVGQKGRRDQGIMNRLTVLF